MASETVLCQYDNAAKTRTGSHLNEPLRHRRLRVRWLLQGPSGGVDVDPSGGFGTGMKRPFEAHVRAVSQDPRHHFLYKTCQAFGLPAGRIK